MGRYTTEVIYYSDSQVCRICHRFLPTYDIDSLRKFNWMNNFPGLGSRTIHHIMPKSVGGTNESTNLMTIMKICHNKLHNHTRHHSLGRAGKDLLNADKDTSSIKKSAALQLVSGMCELAKYSKWKEFSVLEREFNAMNSFISKSSELVPFGLHLVFFLRSNKGFDKEFLAGKVYAHGQESQIDLQIAALDLMVKDGLCSNLDSRYISNNGAIDSFLKMYKANLKRFIQLSYQETLSDTEEKEFTQRYRYVKSVFNRYVCGHDTEILK